MITVATHHPSITGRVRYALSEGRDKETGRLKELEPGAEPRTEVIGSQGFDYQVTDRETADRARRDMERTTVRDDPPPEGRATTKGMTKKPAHELVLSWDENERPSNEHMAATSRSALASLGMREALSVFFRHRDTENDHVHIVSSRINPRTGYVFSDRHERFKLREWANRYERQHSRERGVQYKREQERARRNTYERAAERVWEREPTQATIPRTALTEQERQAAVSFDRAYESKEAFHQGEPSLAEQAGRKPPSRQVGWRESSLEELKDLWAQQASEYPVWTKEQEQRAAADARKFDAGVQREAEEARAKSGRGQHDGGRLHLVRNPIHGAINRAFSDYEGSIDELAIRGRAATTERQILEHKPRELVQREAEQAEASERPPGENSRAEPSDDAAISYAAKVDDPGFRKRRLDDDRAGQTVHTHGHELDHDYEMEMDAEDGFSP